MCIVGFSAVYKEQGDVRGLLVIYDSIWFYLVDWNREAEDSRFRAEA